ncbi:hypothetical protein LXL04_017671 [Taraxacum kok-saghyz]
MSSPSNPSSRDAATSLPCIDRHTQLTPPPPPPPSIASISGINTRMEFELRVFEKPRFGQPSFSSSSREPPPLSSAPPNSHR